MAWRSGKTREIIHYSLLKIHSIIPVTRYIGDFLYESMSSKSRRQSGNSIDNMTTNDLQSILDNALQFPNPVPAETGRPVSPFTAAVRSFKDLEKFIKVQLVTSIGLDEEQARETAALYAETLAITGFSLESLGDTIRNYRPPEPEFEGEPAETVYGHLLETLRDVPFDKYPRLLTDSGLDAHQTNIVRIALEYFSQLTKPASPSPQQQAQPSTACVRTVGEEEEGFIGPMPSAEVTPVGGNTVGQLPQRRYVLMSVSVDTVAVEGRLVVWQVSTHIPGLADDEDPDYECLMLPDALVHKPHILNDLGFTFNDERNMYYHHGPEFGRRKADTEENSLEKFANYLDVSIDFIVFFTKRPLYSTLSVCMYLCNLIQFSHLTSFPLSKYCFNHTFYDVLQFFFFYLNGLISCLTFSNRVNRYKVLTKGDS